MTGRAATRQAARRRPATWRVPATRRAHRVAALALAVLLAGTAVATSAGTAAVAATSTTPQVSITVVSVSPTTPAPTNHPAALTIRLTLVNETSKAIDGVGVTLQRGSPYQTQKSLDAQIDATSASTDALSPIRQQKQEPVDLPVGSPVAVTVRTSTDTVDGHGICLCNPGVYPLFLTAHVDGSDGVDQTLGATRTLLPSFYATPEQPVYVNWVWPLLDRPHRVASTRTFLDDDLAGEVSEPDGRLSRALAVAEQVGPDTPLTLVLDPEIIDELQVMATGSYRVLGRDSKGRAVTTPGTGGAAARAWLARLRNLIAADPDVHVELTPYADPDVQSLAVHGLEPDLSLPAAMRTRVTAALGGTLPDTTVAWPAAGELGHHALRELVADGTGTVVLDATALQHAGTVVPAGLARLRSGGRDVAVAPVTAAVRRYAATAVGTSSAAGAGVQKLLAELAIRVAQQPGITHTAVITVPRYVDPSVDAAVRAIRATSVSTFSTPVSLTSAVAGSTLLPAGHASLARPSRAAAALPEANVAAARSLGTTLPIARSLLDTGAGTDTDADALLAVLPLAEQRVAASAWRRGYDPATGTRFADRLSFQAHRLLTGVHIVRPYSGSYTLASNNSPLPITVENDLPYPVQVAVRVRTALPGQPGFRARDGQKQLIDADSKRTLHVPTQVDRSGRIRVEAELYTPNGAALGTPMPLTVRSTALGTIGVVITIVAGAALVLALLVRAARGLRWRRRAAGRRAGSPAAPVQTSADLAVPGPSTGSAAPPGAPPLQGSPR